MRDGSDSQPAFCYRLYAAELGKGRYGEPVTAVCVEHLADQERPPRKKNLKPASRTALNILWQLIKDSSRSFPLPNMPGLRCVLMNDWEAECIKEGGISQSRENKQRKRAFRTALEDLEANNLIVRDGENGQRVYPVPKDAR
jgi:hypothetical protein